MNPAVVPAVVTEVGVRFAGRFALASIPCTWVARLILVTAPIKRTAPTTTSALVAVKRTKLVSRNWNVQHRDCGGCEGVVIARARILQYPVEKEHQRCVDRRMGQRECCIRPV